MTTIREWLVENKPKHKNRVVWINECTQALGVQKKAVQNMAARIWPFALGANKDLTGSPKPEKGANGDSDVIPSVNFLQEIDDVAKVIEFLNKSVKDDYIEEEKLRRRFGIGQTRWKDIVGLPVFENRRLVYQKPGGSRVTVLSSTKGIEAAKQTLSMARYDV